MPELTADEDEATTAATTTSPSATAISSSIARRSTSRRHTSAASTRKFKHRRARPVSQASRSAGALWARVCRLPGGLLVSLIDLSGQARRPLGRTEAARRAALRRAPLLERSSRSADASSSPARTTSRHSSSSSPSLDGRYDTVTLPPFSTWALVWIPQTGGRDPAPPRRPRASLPGRARPARSRQAAAGVRSSCAPPPVGMPARPVELELAGGRRLLAGTRRAAPPCRRCVTDYGVPAPRAGEGTSPTRSAVSASSAGRISWAVERPQLAAGRRLRYRFCGRPSRRRWFERRRVRHGSRRR